MTQEKWNKVETGIWSPDKIGDSMEATYLGSEDSFVGGRPQVAHNFQKGTDVIKVWGRAQLNGKLEVVPVGSLVKITLKGDLDTSSGFKVKDWEVLWRDHSIT